MESPAEPRLAWRLAGRVGRHLWAGLQGVGRVGFADVWLTDVKDGREDPR
ncbi:hypothetical protein [Streptosporangium sp. H16]